MNLLVFVFYQGDDENDTAGQKDNTAYQGWHTATRDTCSYKKYGTYQKENPTPEMEFLFPVNGHGSCL